MTPITQLLLLVNCSPQTELNRIFFYLNINILQCNKKAYCLTYQIVLHPLMHIELIIFVLNFFLFSADFWKHFRESSFDLEGDQMYFAIQRLVPCREKLALLSSGLPLKFLS